MTRAFSSLTLKRTRYGQWINFNRPLINPCRFFHFCFKNLCFCLFLNHKNIENKNIICGWCFIRMRNDFLMQIPFFLIACCLLNPQSCLILLFLSQHLNTLKQILLWINSIIKQRKFTDEIIYKGEKQEARVVINFSDSNFNYR